MILTRDSLELNPEFPFFISEQVLRKEDNCEDSFHWHSFFEITYIKNGEGHYFVNGKKYNVTKGDIIIFNNVEPHGWFVENEDIEALVMVFSPEFVAKKQSLLDNDYLQPFIERGSNFKNRIQNGDPITTEVIKMISDILEEWDDKKLGYKLMIKANVLRILTLLIRYSQDDTKPDETIQNKKRDMIRLQDAFTYITLHFCEKITLNEVADLVHMSPNYFSTYFHRITNVGFSEYLIQLRLQKAKELMGSTTLNTQEIALRCGFHNMSNFYRQFKKYSGKSPRDNKKME